MRWPRGGHSGLPYRIALYVLAIGFLFSGYGCGLFDGDDLEVTLSADGSVTSETEPVTFTVTATNRGSDRVRWGRGSSSCQLGAVVRVGTRQEGALVNHGGCTDDLVDQALEPGESRTESFSWSGLIVEGGDFAVLPAGAYQVRGAAGTAARSAPLAITVNR
jgi:hypothetical protein